ncbi:Vacuolar protein sorting-associated protein 16 [Porites harrisoni]
MEWQDAVDLSRFIVSAAPFGGPIVLIRDDKHFAQVQGSVINKPIIHIFSSAGKELATVKWDGGPIVQMGWSITEDLLCVADDGTVMVYDIHGAIKKTLSMGQDAKESKVIDCKTYNFAGRTGIAILTSNYHFYVANNVEEVRSRQYYDPPGLDAPPSSWVIMPHDREKGQCNRLTVSFSAGAPVTSIIEMAISYNYEYLAMFTDTGLLWIGSADLQKIYCEFNTSCPSRPKQLTWLVLRRHYCLAIRICDYWKIPKGEGASRILGHLACYKVPQANVEDEEIARAINSKLGETPGISYSEIASKAVDCGRTHLAIKLLDYEAEAADQVPLLMRMNKDDLALEKAIMSGDTDLVFMVVMQLKDNLIPGEFLRAIRYRPAPTKRKLAYCKDQDRRTLADLFYQDHQFMNSGNAFVQDSYSEKTTKFRFYLISAWRFPVRKWEKLTPLKVSLAIWSSELFLALSGRTVTFSAKPTGSKPWEALIRDDKHFARVQGSAINKPIIHIFSSAGRELATVKWDGGPIIQMGWSVTEDLLCVADDGTVMVYDIHGAIKKTLSMGQDAKEYKVIDCKTYNFAGRTGIAILTSNYHFYVANNVEEVRSRRYYDPPGLDAPPSSWVIMPHDRGSSLLVAIDNLLYLTEKGQCNRLTVSFSAGVPVTSIIEMAVSYNYEYLAMFTDTGLLWIGSADLQLLLYFCLLSKVYCEFNTSCPSRPKQLTCCCGTSV